jgi:hypothetical protein
MNDLVIADGNKDDCREIREHLFQLGIVIEAISLGLEALHGSPAAKNVKSELGVLLKFAKEAGSDADTVIALLQKQI